MLSSKELYPLIKSIYYLTKNIYLLIIFGLFDNLFELNKLSFIQ